MKQTIKAWNQCWVWSRSPVSRWCAGSARRGLSWCRWTSARQMAREDGEPRRWPRLGAARLPPQRRCGPWRSLEPGLGPDPSKGTIVYYHRTYASTEAMGIISSSSSVKKTEKPWEAARGEACEGCVELVSRKKQTRNPFYLNEDEGGNFPHQSMKCFFMSI